MSIKLQIFPHPTQIKKSVGGIQSVLAQYAKTLPQYGYQIVPPESRAYDLLSVHAGAWRENLPVTPVAAHCHGLYWTAHLPSSGWEYRANADVINTIRHAHRVSVPSRWVAETFERDFLFSPDLLPHGITLKDYHPTPGEGEYILAFAKNRTGDICSPEFLPKLAHRFPKLIFLTTFAPSGNLPPNIRVIGLQPYENMRGLIRGAKVVMSPIKETFGLLTLEAMASGKPILAFGRGGNLDLVNHEGNGYLYLTHDEMEEGLSKLLENARFYGENSRILAENYTWDKIMPLVDNFYLRTMQVEPAKVSVIIPYHRQTPEILNQTLASVFSQILPADEIILVDTLGKSRKDPLRLDPPFVGATKVIELPGANVAEARNFGAFHASSKYLCFLDADDQIAPLFLKRCVTYLEDHIETHLAYTRITDLYPDGHTQISPWLSQPWDFDASFARRPQVPTCNVLRAETFRRLGGFDPKYCPTGAGAEDGALWFKFGNYGYQCAKVTDEPLFIYRLNQGHTSRPGYTPPNWLDQPRVEARLLPIPTYARQPLASLNLNFSPLVRYYDEPKLSVLILDVPAENHAFDPVLKRTLFSLEAQTFSFWEAYTLTSLSFPAYLKQASTLLDFVSKARGLFTLVLARGDTFDEHFLARAFEQVILQDPLVFGLSRGIFKTSHLLDLVNHPESFQARVETCYNGISFQPLSTPLEFPMCGCQSTTLPLPALPTVLSEYGLPTQLFSSMPPASRMRVDTRVSKNNSPAPVSQDTLFYLARPLHDLPPHFKGKSGTTYGARKTDEVFLVHRDDLEDFIPVEGK